MYESPITEWQTEMQVTYEDECLKAVQRVGFDVNKEELLKALQYDRGQYLTGYMDGYCDAVDEFASQLKEVFKNLNVVAPVIDVVAQRVKFQRGGM